VFNVGPLELMVLAIVGLIVLGPDKVPDLARDAARMIKTLRELATGARTQLREELGPEFADVDLRSLNPRTAISRAILGEEGLTGLGGLGGLNPRELFSEADPRQLIRDAGNSTSSGSSISMDKPAAGPEMQKPLSRGEQAPFDADAT
jgi:sec-independent protein translocase protein TatB